METVFQKIQKNFTSELDIARKYYSIIFELNDIRVTPNELDLISFSAVHGTVSTPPIRDLFIETFKIPKGSIYNMVSRLQKMHILVKDKDKKIRVNPSIYPDFSKPELLLVIKINKNAE